MIPKDLTWAGVVYTAIVTAPAILAAVVSLRNHRALRTGTSKTVGQIAADVHAGALEPAVPLEVGAK